MTEITSIKSQPSSKPSARPIIIGFILVELFVIAIGIGPWMTDRHHKLAKQFAAEGKFDESIPHYRKLIAKFPEGTTLHYELGLVLMNDGRFEEAIPHLEIAASAPDMPLEVYRRLGQAYWRTGQTDKALHMFHRVLKEDSADPVASFYVAEEFFKTKDYEIAASYYEHAASHPDLGAKSQARLKEIESRMK